MEQGAPAAVGVDMQHSSLVGVEGPLHSCFLGQGRPTGGDYEFIHTLRGQYEALRGSSDTV